MNKKSKSPPISIFVPSRLWLLVENGTVHAFPMKGKRCIPSDEVVPYNHFDGVCIKSDKLSARYSKVSDLDVKEVSALGFSHADSWQENLPEFIEYLKKFDPSLDLDSQVTLVVWRKDDRLRGRLVKESKVRRNWRAGISTFGKE